MRQPTRLRAGRIHSAKWLVILAGFLMLANGTRYRFDNGLVPWIRDRNGNRLSYTYDASARVSTITDSFGRQVTVNYDVSDISPYGVCDRIVVG